ncbi:MAG: hypothetical protein ACKPKO_59790 [Candidatus Fonsibacter sp.]
MYIYIYFTEPNVYFRGRIIYTNSTNDFQFLVNPNATARMTLNDSSLTVAGNIIGNTVSCTWGNIWYYNVCSRHLCGCCND